MNNTLTRIAVGTVLAGLPLVGLASPAAAHPHQASGAHQGQGQMLANGADHGPYSAGGLTCGGGHVVRPRDRTPRPGLGNAGQGR